MNQKRRMFPKTTDRVLLTCGLVLGCLGVTSCGGSESSTRPEAGSAHGGVDSSAREVLRIDAANSPDVAIPTAEAGIPDAALRLDLQTTPDTVGVEAPVVNGDVYQAPADVASAQPETKPAQPDVIYFNHDLPSAVELPPAVDSPPDESTPIDSAVDGPGQPDANLDVPLGPSGSGGTGGGGAGGSVQCLVASDCAPQSTVCRIRTCELNRCGVANAPLGTPCQENGGAVCDSDGGCTANHCSDGVQDADETDVDCGGSCALLGKRCKYSPSQQKCHTGGDCESGVCGAQLSVGTGGANGVDGGSGNGGAGGGSGIDAGGSGVLLCQPPSCSDGVKNGDETDVDCGGSCGPTCRHSEPQQKCLVPGDCISGTCSESAPGGGTGGSGGGGSGGSSAMGGAGSGGSSGGSGGGIDAGAGGLLWCQPPSCSDGVKNGDETDVDCGGSCGPTCRHSDPQQKCLVPGDCISGVCGVSAPVGGTGGTSGGSGGDTGGSSGTGGSGGGSSSSLGGTGGGGGSGGAPAAKLCQPCNSDTDCVQNSYQCNFGDGPYPDLAGDTTCLGSICTSCSTVYGDEYYYCALVEACSSEGLGCDSNSPRCVDHCADHQTDFDESDVDCGGSCPQCSSGQYCNSDADCSSGLGCSELDASAYTCVDSCFDGHKDDDESGIDCGGTTCTARCGQGQSCSTDADCQTGLFCDGKGSTCFQD